MLTAIEGNTTTDYQLTAVSPSTISADCHQPENLPRVTQTTVGQYLKPKVPCKETSYGTHFTEYGGIGDRNIIGEKMKNVPTVPRAHLHYGTGVSERSNEPCLDPRVLHNWMDKERAWWVDKPGKNAPRLHGIYQKHTIPNCGDPYFLLKSKHAMFPRPQALEMSSLIAAEKQGCIKTQQPNLAYEPIDCGAQAEGSTRFFPPPCWWSGSSEECTLPVGSINDYGFKRISEQELEKRYPPRSVIHELKIERPERYIPGEIVPCNDPCARPLDKSRGYIIKDVIPETHNVNNNGEVKPNKPDEERDPCGKKKPTHYIPDRISCNRHIKECEKPEKPPEENCICPGPIRIPPKCKKKGVNQPTQRDDKQFSHSVPQGEQVTLSEVKVQKTGPDKPPHGTAEPQELVFHGPEIDPTYMCPCPTATSRFPPTKEQLNEGFKRICVHTQPPKKCKERKYVTFTCPNMKQCQDHTLQNSTSSSENYLPKEQITKQYDSVNQQPYTAYYHRSLPCTCTGMFANVLPSSNNTEMDTSCCKDVPEKSPAKQKINPRKAPHCPEPKESTQMEEIRPIEDRFPCICPEFHEETELSDKFHTAAQKAPYILGTERKLYERPKCAHHELKLQDKQRQRNLAKVGQPFKSDACNAQYQPPPPQKPLSRTHQ